MIRLIDPSDHIFLDRLQEDPALKAHFEQTGPRHENHWKQFLILGWEGGAYLFKPVHITSENPITQQDYVGHLLVEGDSRGAEALQAVRDALDVVFTWGLARTVLGAVPDWHAPARTFSSTAGMRFYARERGFHFGKLEFLDWITQSFRMQELGRESMIGSNLDPSPIHMAWIGFLRSMMDQNRKRVGLGIYATYAAHYGLIPLNDIPFMKGVHP